MVVSSKRVNSANGIVSATISKAVVDAKEKSIAKKIAKDTKIDGFRKGNVPAHVIITRYGAQIKQDAQNELIQEAYQISITELGEVEVLGNPKFEKFEEKEGGLEFEFKLSLRPAMEITDYDKLVPEFSVDAPTDEEVDKNIEEAAKSVATPQKIKRKRMLKKGDFALFDFEGIVDGETIENATAKNFSLEIGNNQFIDGFEDGMIGMKYDETRELNLKFPDEYHAKDIAGKDVKFIVTLHEIQEKVPAEINDEFAKTLLPTDKDMNLEKLKEVVRHTMLSEKKAKLYNDELKPQLLEKLVKTFDFELPELIVEEEINALLNSKLKAMPEEELKSYQEDKEKMEALKKEIEPEAHERVKTTLIIDELAKQENITVTDQEVSQTIYYEAMQANQDPKAMLEYYEKQGFLPIVKMSMLEDRVLSNILNRKLETKEEKGKK